MRTPGLTSLLLLSGLILVSCGQTQESGPDSALLERYPEADQGALNCSPRVLYRDDSLHVSMPMPHPEGLAIRDPNGDWIYLQDEPPIEPSFSSQVFKTMEEFELTPAKTTGFRWVDGAAQRGRVFTVTGEYLIYLADNLETEPENTTFHQTTLYYIDKNRQE